MHSRTVYTEHDKPTARMYSSCECMHKSCTRSWQQKAYHGQGGPMKSHHEMRTNGNRWLPGEGKSIFLQRSSLRNYSCSSRWSYAHAHASSTKWVLNLNKREHKVGSQMQCRCGRSWRVQSGMWMLSKHMHVQDSQIIKNKILQIHLRLVIPIKYLKI